MMKSVAIAAALVILASGARADPLPQFLQQTIAGDLSQIMLGQLAGRKSGSAEVRAFGRAMAEDHTAIELKAIDLAGSLGVPAPNQADDAGRQAYARLQALEGRDFDQAYLGYAIASLQDDIAGFKSIPAKPPGPASSLAKDAVATLQARLETAEALQRGP